VVVVCPTCNDGFPLAERSLRHYHAEGREPLCPQCRRAAAVVLTDKERTRYLNWWRCRFPEAELVALADAIWGP